jgi:hypothetical protein
VCAANYQLKDLSCPDYKAYLVLGKNTLCPRHDDLLNASPSAEEMEILARFGFESEDVFWGKNDLDDNLMNVENAPGERQLTVLRELIELKSLGRSGQKKPLDLTLDRFKEPMGNPACTGSDEWTAKMLVDDLQQQPFVAKLMHTVQSVVKGSDDETWPEDPRRGFFNNMEAWFGTKLPYMAKNHSNSGESLLRQSMESEETRSIEDASNIGQEEFFPHDQSITIWGSVGDRSGLISATSHPPEPSAWLWDKIKCQIRPRGFYDRKGYIGHENASQCLLGPSEQITKSGRKTLLDAKCDGIKWNWNGYDWVGTVPVPPPVSKDRFPPNASSEAKVRTWTGRIGVEGSMSSTANGEKKDGEEDRSSSINMGREKRQSVALMDDEYPGGTAETQQPFGPNRLDELRRRLELYEQENNATLRSKRMTSFSRNGIKGLWGDFKRRSMM